VDCGGQVKKPIVIVLNGPSCAGKSTIAKCFLSKVDQRDWAMVDFDNVTEKEAGVKDRDSDEDIERKLHECLIEKIKKALGKGKNVVCDTILRDEALVNLYKSIQKCKLFMCFIHNPIPRLIKHLEARNIVARKVVDEYRYLEKRSFKQVLIDFGRFYLPSGSVSCLGELSRQQMDVVFKSNEAKVFAADVYNKNGQCPGSPRSGSPQPLNELIDKLLSVYPVFKYLNYCEKFPIQLVAYDLYDLIIDNELPELSSSIILNVIQQN